MFENPYQAPTSLIRESAQPPRHRSFRLTPDSTGEHPWFRVGSIRQAIEFALLTQIPLLLFCSIIPDQGIVFRTASVTTGVFWCWTAWTVIRSRKHYAESDILVVKWGFLPMFLILHNAWLICHAVSNRI